MYNSLFTTKYVAPRQLWEANMRIAGNKIASASGRNNLSLRRRAYIHQGEVFILRCHPGRCRNAPDLTFSRPSGRENKRWSKDGGQQTG